MIFRLINKIKKSDKVKLLQMLPKHSVCAEIGVWKGDFSKKILNHIKPLRLHLIDPWLFQPDYTSRWYGGAKAKEQLDMDRIFETVLRETSKYPQVEVHRDFSSRVFSKFPDNYFDWVYIDGNHSFEYVLSDLNQFASKININGFITGDDMFWLDENGNKSVSRAIVDFLRDHPQFELVEIIGNQFIIKKVS